MDDDTTLSLQVGEDYFTLHDDLAFRRTATDAWQVGYVCGLNLHAGSLQVASSATGKRLWITPGFNGELQPLRGPAMVAAAEGIPVELLTPDLTPTPAPPPPPPPPPPGGAPPPPRPKNQRGLKRRTPLTRKKPLRPRWKRQAPAQAVRLDPATLPPDLAKALPPLRVALCQSPRGPLHKPRPPARCAAYVATVQREPCCACEAPAPSEAHHAGPRGVSQKTSDFLVVPLCYGCHVCVTRRNAVPGRSREETRQLIQAVQVALLQRWAEAKAREEAETFVEVPVLALQGLRLVAGGRR